MDNRVTMSGVEKRKRSKESDNDIDKKDLASDSLQQYADRFDAKLKPFLEEGKKSMDMIMIVSKRNVSLPTWLLGILILCGCHALICVASNVIYGSSSLPSSLSLSSSLSSSSPGASGDVNAAVSLYNDPAVNDANVDTDANLASKRPEERTAAFITAVNPNTPNRYSSLWSQLECLVHKDRFQTVIIAAPDWAETDPIFNEFISLAQERIPNLQGVDLQMHYHFNDRYDVGLWCDSLNGKDTTTDAGTEPPPSSSLLRNHDDFVLINDSLWILERDYTAVLDTLRDPTHDPPLAMTSLNYSTQGSLPDHPWLESAFRAFNHKGIRAYMANACVPATHRSWCHKMSMKTKKKCIVQAFEIGIADLFDPDEVQGLYSSDVPPHMVRPEVYLHRSPMWHSHIAYWTNVLRPMKFPAIKSSKERMIKKTKKTDVGQQTLNTCLQYMEPEFLKPIEDRVFEQWKTNGQSADKTNVLQEMMTRRLVNK